MTRISRWTAADVGNWLADRIRSSNSRHRMFPRGNLFQRRAYAAYMPMKTRVRSRAVLPFRWLHSLAFSKHDGACSLTMGPFEKYLPEKAGNMIAPARRPIGRVILLINNTELCVHERRTLRLQSAPIICNPFGHKLVMIVDEGVYCYNITISRYSAHTFVHISRTFNRARVILRDDSRRRVAIKTWKKIEH